MKKITRIGVGGPVGSGKTALIEAITPILLKMGIRIVIITNDIVTTEDAKHVQRTLKGILAEERIMGVMVESHLVEGRQDLSPDKPLTYGQSVTDACINWDDSVAVMEKLAAAVRARRLAEAAE